MQFYQKRNCIRRSKSITWDGCDLMCLITVNSWKIYWKKKLGIERKRNFFTSQWTVHATAKKSSFLLFLCSGIPCTSLSEWWVTLHIVLVLETKRVQRLGHSIGVAVIWTLQKNKIHFTVAVMRRTPENLKKMPKFGSYICLMEMWSLMAPLICYCFVSKWSPSNTPHR